MPEEVTVEVTDVVGEWTRFLKKQYRRELAELSREYPHSRSLTIDYRTILNNRLAFELLRSPGKVIGDIRDAIIQNKLIKLKDGEDPEHINIRFTNLPQRTDVRDIRAEQINTLVAIEGIIRKTTEVRPRIVSAVFRCRTCGKLTDPVAQGYGRFDEPDFCPNCERKTRLDLVMNRCRFVDTQKIRVQESPEGLRGGEQPQTLDVDVTDDLTGLVAPGDRVVVNGILRSVQRINYGQKSTLFDIYLECNSIEIAEKEFEEIAITEEDEAEIKALARDPMIYKKIIRSIAPTIYGTDDVKEAIALQLFGGIPKEMPDGSRLRGDIHVLLVGDPGIAKSQILRYVVKLSPRGIYTSGKSSTSAGLTATAVKDEFGDGRWTLEAGALVLADMGIAAVDEMDKMAKEDRSALHEAMEQQSISVAKAGITATLKSRCALLGAANPKLGRFDQFVPIAEQINMPPSLLSRFDLIFVMTDQPEAERDEAIASHIIKTHRVGELIKQHKYSPLPGVDEEYIQRALAPVTPDIEPSLLRKYIAYAKRTCFPILSDGAQEALISYYMRLRSLATGNKPVPVTARQLEALVRLAEASARMRLSDTIDTEDTDRVLRIVDSCLRQVAYDAESGSFDIDKLVTGVPKSRRDIIRSVKETIRNLSGDAGGQAKVDEVIEVLVQQGFSRDRIEETIEHLKRGGELLEPRHGLIKVIG
ncbi:MAG TPA: minichromosome maintenance protein MCM [Candidatus Methanoculleus thermohydrogenotrophicum]|nr:minichromosome maintenance protein MCM [Candidatus Methanoculleus thermohydrogenotrophicum]NLM82659.1 minichromosome maintenance protein MCM [Candidatus Methanoculleus thermohydrogenotrophicum]HOB18211.1 minichromosome maintenance protein MCM [Candidatus Methanoculleus thermohydrogenotrophicum]HPZ37852.1 minichromosome maintenance protein MCM [Candidatus Methanoculleus thermohydrogenotrophicum]HQC91078.1 minichromosome maintenance protein MCM [Candidatus Methanoculleus thermohydrogenotrophic